MRLHSYQADFRNKWNFSYDCFKDDLERCHQLGIKLYNWQ